MDFAQENNKERDYFKQDFSSITEIIKRIRTCLITGEKIDLGDLSYNGVLDYIPDKFYLFITLFQPFTNRIRFGSKKETLEKTIDNVILNLRKKADFYKFHIENSKQTRILLEWETEEKLIPAEKIHMSGNFDEYRFEPGITGIKILDNQKKTFWMPTDTHTNNEFALTPILAKIGDKMGLTKDKNLDIDEKAKLVKKTKDVEFYLTKSHAFVSTENEAVPLYRGNTYFDDFNYDTLLNIFKNSCEYLVKNMNEENQFMYYYNATKDNNIDHDHPTRKPPNLYYNDLRHCGGAITLLRMYETTNDEKFLNAAKRALDWIAKITIFHKDKQEREAAYIYANKKAKLGGVGLGLILSMKYRMCSGDKTYDRYIEAYARHLISRITESGEFLGYYIHPNYQDGRPLEELSFEERKELFSFYYPGEALLGLALFVNHYNSNPKLVQEVKEKSKTAMYWIINKRRECYPEMFKSLPSDSWLMQAIEEWSYCDGFIEKCDIDFVYNDAKAMMDRMYKKNDSPYIDYEGGMYYKYGDYYHTDTARCEGLISAYYLAKRLKDEDFAENILQACKKAAKSQFQLYISKLNNYAHRNPDKSEKSIKFKPTTQWIRVDSIQHTACFFIRLYLSEHNSHI